MATLTNNKIKDTYQGLIKTNGNSVVSGTNQYLTDGFGNLTPLSVGTNNIGIGTTSTSSYKLDVSGTGRFTSTLLAQGSITSNASVEINNSSSDGGSLVLHSSGYNNWQLDNFSGSLRIYSGGSIRQTILQNGNVGIGATIPSYKLDVTGTGRFTDTLTVSGTGNSSFAGKLGIGTTIPKSRFTVYGTGVNINLDIGSDITDTYSSIIWNGSSGNVTSQPNAEIRGIRAGSGALGAIAFHTRGSSTFTSVERVRITSEGFVGIGTTEPKSKLQVLGLPNYANNATALAGGLTVGAFYHTAGILKVVI